MIENAAWSELIIAELLEQGVDYFCIAPGSRNTPLVLAVAENKKAKKIVHYDERGIGFHGLGYSKGAQKPACVIVTSGTATGNLLPSIMEAHTSFTPLIVLTADRPPELQDCGSLQTIDQIKLFRDFVRWQSTIPCPEENLTEFLRSSIAYAVFKAKTAPSGPVHLNCMFREPLFIPSAMPLEPLQRPKTRYFYPELTIEVDLSLPKKGLILIGRMPCKESLSSIYSLANHLGWPVIADILSQDRLYSKNENTITHYDLLLKTTPLPIPEAILHFGDRFISKKLLEWLGQIKPILYASIWDQPVRYDPSHLLTHRFFCNSNSFCESLLNNPPNQDERWLATWQKKDAIAQTVVEKHLKNEELTESIFAHLLACNLPNHFSVFFGSSMPIRDADLFFHPIMKPVGIFANRGTAGIDGNIATAVGISVGLNKPCAIVIGDQAFLHDLNSIAQIKNAKHPIVLFIINNSGGGIFNFLPVGKSEHFEKFFKAKHNFTFAGIAESFDFPYHKISNFKELELFFKKEISGSMFVEVITEDVKNLASYQELYSNLQTAFKEEVLCPVR